MSWRRLWRVGAMVVYYGWLGGVGAVEGAEPRGAVMVLAVGAAGAEEYGELFRNWAEQWKQAAKRGGVRVVEIGLEAGLGKTAKDQLRLALEQEPKESPSELWLVLVGHGTFDGKESKFNLEGPDVSAGELSEWLEPFRRAVAVVNASSSSAPFINALSGQGRVVVTATKSGFEENFARFGGYMAGAIGAAEADLDKDGQTSLLEAFLLASRQVAEFYELEGRLATEHALLDDNGDGLGTPADWYRGVRAIKKAQGQAVPDGFRAHQIHLIRSESEQKMPEELRVRRDELELSIFRMRERKSEMGEEEYYGLLEPLLLEMARVYEEAEGGGDQESRNKDQGSGIKDRWLMTDD